MINPTISIPKPEHDKPKHGGWKKWCKYCCELKEYVDWFCGGTTKWTGRELTDRRKKDAISQPESTRHL